jgi:hypothetical protein
MLDILKGDMESVLNSLISGSTPDEQGAVVESIIRKVLDYDTLSGSVSPSVSEEVQLLNRVRCAYVYRCEAVPEWGGCVYRIKKGVVSLPPLFVFRILYCGCLPFLLFGH